MSGFLILNQCQARRQFVKDKDLSPDWHQKLELLFYSIVL